MDSTNSYQLNQGEDNYILSITLIEETIKISCDNSKGQIYSKIFTLEDIKSIDELFASIESALDVIDFFDDILRNEKVRVEEESGLLQILFVTSDERSITITLDKEAEGEGEVEAEGEVGENYQQEQDTNYMEQTNENQLEQNISANYYESMRNLNPDLDPELNVNVTLNTNAANAQVNMDNFEVQQNEENIPQEATNVEEYQATNYNAENTGDFNIEEYLKNNQAEINSNVENNIEMNNVVENTDTNYIQDTTAATTTTNINEFTNINTTEELTTNINEVQQVQNIENVEKAENVENVENIQNIEYVVNTE